MSQYAKAQTTPEIQTWIGVIALIMRLHPGPISKKEVALELEDIFNLSQQEMKNKIITAIQTGIRIGRFKVTTQAKYELA